MNEKEEASVLDRVKECPHCKGEISVDASKCRHCGEWIDKSKKPNTYGGATVVGYFFAIFGGWLGIVVGLYLLTRDNEKAKLHGKIILGISGIWILLIIILMAGRG